jgi:hypothetical protein
VRSARKRKLQLRIPIRRDAHVRNSGTVWTVDRKRI